MHDGCTRQYRLILKVKSSATKQQRYRKQKRITQIALFGFADVIFPRQYSARSRTDAGNLI